MNSIQITSGESKRLESLYRLDILDTPREKQFDRIVCLAVAVFRVPIAAISMIAETRQWLKAHVGSLQVEMPRDMSFCDHALTAAGPVVIENAAADPRFHRNPLVTASPKVRFYAGVPIRGPDAQPVGALCIIDVVSRTLGPPQLLTLMQLGEDVSELLRVIRRQKLQVGDRARGSRPAWRIPDLYPCTAPPGQSRRRPARDVHHLVDQPATARFPSWRPRRSASHRRRGAVFSHAELHRRLPTPRISADATITAATPAKARRGVRDRYRTAPLGFDWECYDDATPTTAT
jgi:hypothetical protein